MNMEQIKCVLAVVRYKTFLEASFHLNCSQAAVSKSIKKLEEELGIPLFERTTRRVALTEAGEDFVVYGQQILHSYECILNSVERRLNPGVSRLIIGSIYFGRDNRLAPMIASFLKLHPDIEIEMKENTSSPLIQALRSGELDAAFVSSMYNPSMEDSPFSEQTEFRFFSCFRDPYYVIVSKNHPFAKRKSLSYPDLKGQSFIVTDPSMDVYHKALQKTFERYRTPLHIAMYCTSVRSVLHMVSQDLGIAILSKLVVEESGDLRIIPLEDQMIRDTQLVVLNKNMPPPLRAFYHFIKKQIL